VPVWEIFEGISKLGWGKSCQEPAANFLKSMLPGPVSYSIRRSFRRNATIPRRNIIDILLTRARVTNLAVLLLASFVVMSMVTNLSFYYSTRPSTSLESPPPPSSILATLSREKAVQNLNHLIIVPGHAIWKGTNPDLRLNEDQWVLEPYQKGRGCVAAVFSHISSG